MQLKVGTIIEPKYDKNIEHAVVVDYTVPRRGSREKRYVIETVKSRTVALLTEEELFSYYEPIGQEEVGKVLFGGKL